VSQFPQGPGMPMEQAPHIGGDLAPYLNHEELAILLGLGERLVSELDADNVLKLVAKTACEVVQAETLVVPIIDFKGQTYSYAASSGKYADQLQGPDLYRWRRVPAGGS
jgi:hypothetical protein